MIKNWHGYDVYLSAKNANEKVQEQIREVNFQPPQKKFRRNFHQQNKKKTTYCIMFIHLQESRVMTEYKHMQVAQVETDAGYKYLKNQLEIKQLFIMTIQRVQFFLIGIHSMHGWTATTRYGIWLIVSSKWPSLVVKFSNRAQYRLRLLFFAWLTVF